MSGDVDAVAREVLGFVRGDRPSMALSSLAPFAFRRRPQKCSSQTHSSAAPQYDCLPILVSRPPRYFGAALTRAVVINNILGQADWTFFLGGA